MHTMENWLSRMELLMGQENVTKLQQSNILLMGLGGVGGYAAEQLARAGIGNMTIIDGDVVVPSNRNRQIIALTSTHGKPKAEVVKERLLDINPDIKLRVINDYVCNEKMQTIIDRDYDYVVDAIDTPKPKLVLMEQCLEKNIKLVSAMGAGGKVDPSRIHVADISESHTCKLAWFIRRKLHKRGIYTGFKVVFSSENVNKNAVKLVENERNKKSTVGTISYMPAIFGCICASVVIRDLLQAIAPEKFDVG